MTSRKTGFGYDRERRTTIPYVFTGLLRKLTKSRLQTTHHGGRGNIANQNGSDYDVPGWQDGGVRRSLGDLGIIVRGQRREPVCGRR
jgi:hypothetical protein